MSGVCQLQSSWALVASLCSILVVSSTCTTQAVRLKERGVASEVVAVSCGPLQCQVRW